MAIPVWEGYALAHEEVCDKLAVVALSLSARRRNDSEWDERYGSIGVVWTHLDGILA